MTNEKPGVQPDKNKFTSPNPMPKEQREGMDTDVDKERHSEEQVVKTKEFVRPDKKSTEDSTRSPGV